jgi:hypothetical protein
MPAITELNLIGMLNLTDKALEFVGRLCPRLKRIDLTGCVRISGPRSSP